ncbi:MAG: hypothetical protein VXZ99_01990 [Pseudomonadota bacterium]|nr:hypothetical protein [Pseudomonadota bacterium]
MVLGAGAFQIRAAVRFQKRMRDRRRPASDFVVTGEFDQMREIRFR